MISFIAGIVTGAVLLVALFVLWVKGDPDEFSRADVALVRAQADALDFSNWEEDDIRQLRKIADTMESMIFKERHNG